MVRNSFSLLGGEGINIFKSSLMRRGIMSSCFSFMSIFQTDQLFCCGFGSKVEQIQCRNQWLSSVALGTSSCWDPGVCLPGQQCFDRMGFLSEAEWCWDAQILCQDVLMSLRTHSILFPPLSSSISSFSSDFGSTERLSQYGMECTCEVLKVPQMLSAWQKERVPVHRECFCTEKGS